jgi:hypothetical protein
MMTIKTMQAMKGSKAMNKATKETLQALSRGEPRRLSERAPSRLLAVTAWSVIESKRVLRISIAGMLSTFWTMS